MFGTGANSTSDLMLPILFDMANLIRRAVGPGKRPREAQRPQNLPSAQMLRRSFNDDEIIDLAENKYHDGETSTVKTMTPTGKIFQRNFFANRNRLRATSRMDNVTEIFHMEASKNESYPPRISENNGNASLPTDLPKPPAPETKSRSLNISKQAENNDDPDLSADVTNQTVTQELPVAEKLRSLTRFVDRKGNTIRRGQWSPNKQSIVVTRRTTTEPAPILPRKRTVPSRKLPTDPNCDLFTNSVCLRVDDYPIEAILLSIRRNKAATSALLADYRDSNEGAIDGVSAAQEAKYTADHYLVSNRYQCQFSKALMCRRGDAASRDFAGAGEAGFMCPSTVKYARPQRARATSGQWKYIVNTGEHTQTLRLEKCLKPKESCTYLTENFKSKCVQVYNYHRLLTWDQKSGLHMDIFKVPTCCSCHIEGYNVNFPPLGQNDHEIHSEHFPGEDISPEHGNGAFETVQPTAPKPSVIKNAHFELSKPIESFSTFGENQNFISGTGFPSKKLIENDNFSNGHIPATDPVDSYGNHYFVDSFDQASSIKNVKRPTSARNPIRSKDYNSFITLPSFLEPPTPTADSPFSLVKESQIKYKNIGNPKRGAARLNRKPTRKNISGGPEDLLSSGTSAVSSHTSLIAENAEDFHVDKDEYDIHTDTLKRLTISPKLKIATPTVSPESTFQPTLPTITQNRSTPRDSMQGKRVNYNYHPIIDFFESNGKDYDTKSSIDRGDTTATLIPTQETEWKPINRPTSSNIQSPKVPVRRRYK
ncbi:Neurotrophin 1 [Eumeta japonica]|uniref:Neurotrophin 1 n=1 Tax=Eumeta variegata TaxID=151549 RepID=A0A4C1XE00_EUMVA|nr:Neurotrophin 1 [Eumeta japonica]